MKNAKPITDSMEVDTKETDITQKEENATEEETLDEMETAFVEPSSIISDADKPDLRQFKFYEMLYNFYNQVQGAAEIYHNPNEADEVPVWKTAAYTIQTAENLLRLDEKPLLGTFL